MPVVYLLVSGSLKQFWVGSDAKIHIHSNLKFKLHSRTASLFCNMSHGYRKKCMRPRSGRRKPPPPRSLLRRVSSWCLHMGWPVSFHDWGFTLALATGLLSQSPLSSGCSLLWPQVARRPNPACLLFFVWPASQELFSHLLNGWGRRKKKILWPMKKILKCKFQNTSLMFWRNTCPVL